MNKTNLLTGTLLAALMFSSSVLAELPSWYPRQFDAVGFVDMLSGSSIFIDDRSYILSPTVKFATPDSKEADLNQLKIRDLIGFNIITINSRRLVDRIWLIPKDDPSYRPIQ